MKHGSVECQPVECLHTCMFLLVTVTLISSETSPSNSSIYTNWITIDPDQFDKILTHWKLECNYW